MRPRSGEDIISVNQWFLAAAAGGTLAISAVLSSYCAEEAPPPAVSAEAPPTPTIGSTGGISAPEAVPQAEGLRDPHKLDIASQIISTFENSTTEIQYGYAENIEDGRGITAGRSGFTSETHDLREVVERYQQKEPGNPLEAYLPTLQKAEETEVVEDLPGFIEVWKSLEDDPALREAQDDVFEEWYLEPALRRADELGVQTPLGQLILLDTIIQHGEGGDPDGLPAIQQEVVDKVGTATEAGERQWLEVFLEVREAHLMNAADPATRQGWQESVSRVRDTLRRLLNDGNFELNNPSWTVYGDRFQISE